MLTTRKLIIVLTVFLAVGLLFCAANWLGHVRGAIRAQALSKQYSRNHYQELS